jgi:sugar lactone lactonase YvrE
MATFVADGHGNARVVKFDKDGKFIKAWGKKGEGPGEFNLPHTLVIDSRGRVLVGDRSNNRIQIFDKEMNYLDSWKHFGRPSGITILKDDTMFVADSESGIPLPGPKQSFEGEGTQYRNVGWKQGVRIGSARDGSLRMFIDATNPEGMAADELGNVFAGLTGGCGTSKSGGCVQKWIKK